MSGWSRKASEAELKGVEVFASGLKPWCGRRDAATGTKFLKERRAPRRRGRMGTSVNRLRTRLRPSLSIAGRIDCGCSTCAPKYASSVASSKVKNSKTAVLSISLGSAERTPSTSFHTCTSGTFKAAPITVAVRSEGRFHTSERRGGVERRQLKLKGVEAGIESERWAERCAGQSP